ncbi:glycosyl hydrolase BNR repeat-containing protein, partial [mine drainage metagenome]
EVHGNDLIAATQGRAIWVLDDVTPLRQLSSAVLASTAHLFAPEVAWRVHWNNNQDTPLPPGTPQGRNPPDGVPIDYWLGPHTHGPVTLAIYDFAGKRVRRFASDAVPRPIHAFRYFAKGWLKPPKRLSAAPGMHRFVWNLRYARPPAISYQYSMAAVWGENTPTAVDGPFVLPVSTRWC